MRMTSVNVCLPKKERDELWRLANSLGVSMGVIMRNAFRTLVRDLEEEKHGPFIEEGKEEG